MARGRHPPLQAVIIDRYTVNTLDKKDVYIMHCVYTSGVRIHKLTK